MRIVVIGGDKRTPALLSKYSDLFDSYHINEQKKLTNGICPDADAVVILSKFSNTSLNKAAKEMAEFRGIPLVRVRSVNHVVNELKSKGLLKPQDTPGKAGPVRDDSKPVLSSTPTVGVSTEELWAKYGEAAVSAIRKLLKPNELISEDDLVEAMALPGGVGLPKEDCRLLLPELSVQGVIGRSGTGWKCMASDYEYVPGQETPEAKKETKNEDPLGTAARRSWREKVEAIIKALPRGPYESQMAIFRNASQYEGFTPMHGGAWDPKYGAMFMYTVKKRGLTEQIADGQWIVKNDPSLTLPSKKKQGGDSPDIPKKASPSSGQEKDVAVPPPAPSYEKGSTISLPAPSLPVTAGSSYVPLSKLGKTHEDASLPATVRKRFSFQPLGVEVVNIKKIVPQGYWDEMAARAIARVLATTVWREYMQLRDDFKQEEWDALAWNCLRMMPFEVVLGILKLKFK